MRSRPRGRAGLGGALLDALLDEPRERAREGVLARIELCLALRQCRRLAGRSEVAQPAVSIAARASRREQTLHGRCTVFDCRGRRRVRERLSCERRRVGRARHSARRRGPGIRHTPIGRNRALCRAHLAGVHHGALGTAIEGVPRLARVPAQAVEVGIHVRAAGLSAPEGASHIDRVVLG